MIHSLARPSGDGWAASAETRSTAKGVMTSARRIVAVQAFFGQSATTNFHTRNGFIWETISPGCKGLLVFVEPSKTVYGKLLVNSGLSAPGRSHNHTVTLLERFSGVIHTDGCDAHRTLARKRNGIVLAHCSAHVRRKFFDFAKADSAPIAEEALRRIGELYVVEDEIRGQNPDLCAAAATRLAGPPWRP